MFYIILFITFKIIKCFNNLQNTELQCIDHISNIELQCIDYISIIKLQCIDHISNIESQCIDYISNIELQSIDISKKELDHIHNSNLQCTDIDIHKNNKLCKMLNIIKITCYMTNKKIITKILHRIKKNIPIGIICDIINYLYREKCE